MEDIRQSIESIASQLGAGLVYPVAYDTAWAARVPSMDDLHQPAFPSAVEWLRKNQLADGSWGTNQPLNAHGNTLCTLAAILALKQWGNPNDETHLQEGVAALHKIAESLQNETYETIGFELVLPQLEKEAKAYNLDLPYHVYEKYQQASEEKRKMVQAFQKKFGFGQPHSWWFTLESVGVSLSQKQEEEPEVLKHVEALMKDKESVAGSPAATAYLLALSRFYGKDIPKAFAYIEKIVNLFNGGVPNIYPIDEFELSFSTSYLLEAGVSPFDPIIKPAVEKVLKHWEDRKESGFGYSSEFIIDSDDTSNALAVLHAIGRPVSPDILFPFFNGTTFQTYPGERKSSISINLNVLKTLQNFKSNPVVQEMISKMVTWLEGISATNDTDPVFEDKWHYSPIYPISRAIYALEGNPSTLFSRCMNWLIKNQRDDGGWGFHQISTTEETAHAALALSYCFRKGYSVPFSTLEKAEKYFSNAQTQKPSDCLWIGKTLYCPFLVLTALTSAARYGLQKAREFDGLSNFVTSLRTNDLVSYDGGEIKTEKISLNAKGTFLCPVPTKVNANISNLLVKDHTLQWAVEYELCNSNSKFLKTDLGSVISHSFNRESPDDLNLLADFSFLYLVIDDILDHHWEKLDPTGVTNALTSFTQIIQGETKETSKLPKVEFERFLPICKALVSIRTRIEGRVKGQQLQRFSSSAKGLFTAFLEEYKFRVAGHELNVKDYVKLRIGVGSADPFFELGLGLRSLEVEESILQNPLFAQAKYHAYKSMLIINDICSFPKEVARGEVTQNYLFFKKPQHIFPLQEAFEHAVGACNLQIAQLLMAEQALLKEFSNSSVQSNQVTESISLLKDLVQGHLVWCLKTPRYQTQKVSINFSINNSLTLKDLNIL